MAKKTRKKFDRSRRYTPKMKRTILSVTKIARKSGKTWAQTFTDARKAGYLGTVAGLEIMLRKAGGGAKSARKVGRPAKQTQERGVGKGTARTLAKAARTLRKLAKLLEGAVR